MKRIVVLDYGLGNVRSVGNAIRAIGAEAEVTRNDRIIAEADGMIIPGVGAFPDGMANLTDLGLVEVIHKFIDSGRPLLGICLGMQLLFEKGVEYQMTQGLSLISGSVEIIPVKPEVGRLPHIAWSTIKPTEIAAQTMFAGMSDQDMRFYFVHSYAATGLQAQNLSATVDYMGHEIVAAVQRKNVWGTQFHPEKSGLSGLQVLRNFILKADNL